MEERIPAIIFGAFLIITGGLLLFLQKRPEESSADDAVSASERRFLQKRFRRRRQVAGMILLIGVMIPVGDSLIPWQDAPKTFAVYWLIVITLALWTGALAVGDIASTRAHMATEINRLHRQQLELRNVARRLQKSQRDGQS